MIQIELTEKEAENLARAMEWWKTSGVNYWQVTWAEDMLAKLNKETN